MLSKIANKIPVPKQKPSNTSAVSVPGRSTGDLKIITSKELQRRHNLLGRRRSDDYRRVIDSLNGYHKAKKGVKNESEYSKALRALIDSCRQYVEKKDERSATRKTVQTILEQASQELKLNNVPPPTNIHEKPASSDELGECISKLNDHYENLLTSVNKFGEALHRIKSNAGVSQDVEDKGTSIKSLATDDSLKRSNSVSTARSSKNSVASQLFCNNSDRIQMKSDELPKAHSVLYGNRSSEYRAVIDSLDKYHQARIDERKKSLLELIDNCKRYIETKDDKSGTKRKVQGLMGQAYRALALELVSNLNGAASALKMDVESIRQVDNALEEVIENADSIVSVKIPDIVESLARNAESILAWTDQVELKKGCKEAVDTISSKCVNILGVLKGKDSAEKTFRSIFYSSESSNSSQASEKVSLNATSINQLRDRVENIIGAESLTELRKIAEFERLLNDFEGLTADQVEACADLILKILSAASKTPTSDPGEEVLALCTRCIDILDSLEISDKVADIIEKESPMRESALALPASPRAISADEESVKESVDDRYSPPASFSSSPASVSESSSQLPADSKTEPQFASSVSMPKNHPWIAGQDGYFYSLSQKGDLYRYDSTANDVIKTHIEGVDGIKLGADESLYSWDKDKVTKLAQDGSKDQTISISNIRDLAVSSNGNHLFVLRKDGTLIYHGLKNSETSRAEPVFLSVPADITKPRSIAVSANGKVWLLDGNGCVWNSQVFKTGSDAIIGVWNKVDEPSESLIGLETLPDGTVAGRDKENNLWRHRSQSSELNDVSIWKQASLDSLQPFQDLHEKLKSRSGPEVITFLGGMAVKEGITKSSVRSKLTANPIEAIKKRYTYLRYYTWEKKSKKEFGYLSSMDAYAREVKEYQRRLSSAEIGSPCSEVLKSIENLKWNTKEKTEKYLDLLSNMQPQTDRDSRTDDEHMLVEMKSVLEYLYGKEDTVVKKLNSAIDNQLFFNPESSAKAAEIIAEYAILAETIQKLSNGGDVNETLSQAVRMRNESRPHIISSLGVDQTDPFGKAAAAFDHIQRVFTKKNDLLTSIVKHVHPDGAECAKDKSISEMAILFENLINNMKEGNSITLKKTKDVGFNTETFRLAFSGAVATVAGSPLIAWAIPVFDIGKQENFGLSISKTDNGISVSVLDSSGEYGQFGVRGGVGTVGAAGSGWGFVGWELAAKASHSRKEEDSIAFKIDDDGTGNIGRAVTDIFTGRADLFELLKKSDATVSTQKRETETKGSVSNVVVGVVGDTWEKIPEDRNKTRLPVLKVLTALVPELLVTCGKKSIKGESKANDGQRTAENTKRPWGVQEIKGSVVGVSVFETDAVNKPDGIARIDDKGLAMGSLLRLGVPSFLPGVLGAVGWNRIGRKTKSTIIKFSSDGKPQNVEVNLEVKYLRNLVSEFDKNGLGQIPGMQNALQKLKKNGSPINIVMELRPDKIKDLPKDNDAREKEMEKLAKDSSNFRVKELNVPDCRATEKKVMLPVPAITREVGGEIETNAQSSKIIFFYDIESIIEQAKLLLDDIANFDNGVWGTKDRQKRLGDLVNQFFNLVDSLGRTPPFHGQGTGHNLKRGEGLYSASIKKEYEKAVNILRSSLMHKVDLLLRQRVGPELKSEVMHALNEFKDGIDEIQNGKESKFRKLGLRFEGPAIVASGQIFSPTAGKFSKKIQGKQHELMKEVYNALEQLERCNLGSKRTFERKKAEKKANRYIDDIMLCVNAMMGNVNCKRKEALFAQLPALAIRSTSEQHDTAVRLLKELAWYADPQPLSEFPEIYSDLVARLQEVGVEDSEQLYRLACDGPVEFERITKLKLGEDRVAKLISLCDLYRLPGMNISFAKLLMKTGFSTLRSIELTTPRVLYEAIIKAHGQILTEEITESGLEQVIESAKRANEIALPDDKHAAKLFSLRSFLWGNEPEPLVYRLLDAGIDDTKKLRDEVGDNFNKFVEKHNLNEKNTNELEKLLKLADLCRVPGMRSGTAEILLSIECNSVSELAGYDLRDLHKKMNQANSKLGLYNKITEGEIAKLINNAKYMTNGLEIPSGEWDTPPVFDSPPESSLMEDDRGGQNALSQWKASPRHDELNASPKHDELNASPKHDEWKASPKYDELKASPKYDELNASPKYDELNASPRHDDTANWKRGASPDKLNASPKNTSLFARSVDNSGFSSSSTYDEWSDSSALDDPNNSTEGSDLPSDGSSTHWQGSAGFGELNTLSKSTSQGTPLGVDNNLAELNSRPVYDTYAAEYDVDGKLNKQLEEEIRKIGELLNPKKGVETENSFKEVFGESLNTDSHGGHLEEVRVSNRSSKTNNDEASRLQLKKGPVINLVGDKLFIDTFGKRLSVDELPQIVQSLREGNQIIDRVIELEFARLSKYRNVTLIEPSMSHLIANDAVALNEETLIKMEDNKNLTDLILVPVSDSECNGSGSHWTLLALKLNRDKKGDVTHCHAVHYDTLIRNKGDKGKTENARNAKVIAKKIVEKLGEQSKMKKGFAEKLGYRQSDVHIDSPQTQGQGYNDCGPEAIRIARYLCANASQSLDLSNFDSNTLRNAKIPDARTIRKEASKVVKAFGEELKKCNLPPAIKNKARAIDEMCSQIAAV